MALRDEIQAAQDRLAEAVCARDAKAAAAPYTDDARLIPQGARACDTPDAIAAFFAGAFANGIVSARFITGEVEGDDAQAAQGRYLVVWRKVDGMWRMHRDMFNTL